MPKDNAANADDVSLELEKVRLEREALELEDLRDRVSAQRQRKEAAKRESEARAESARREAAKRKGEQSSCPHKTGGMGFDGLARGDDNKFCIAHHRLPTGVEFLVCQRCKREWLPGTEGYNEMAIAPTANSPSASVQFVLSRAV